MTNIYKSQCSRWTIFPQRQ